jgi:DNA-binding response OmpR family regulator
MPFLLLSAGRDPNVLKQRNAQLLAAGFKVASATNSHEVVEKLLNGDFDLVLLCDSMPDEDRNRLARIVSGYTPSTPVVLISIADGEEHAPGGGSVRCHPEQLLATVAESLQRRDTASQAA